MDDMPGYRVREVMATKDLRIVIRQMVEDIRKLDTDHGSSREKSLAKTKLQEAGMWLGMELRRLADGESCYPNSYDSTTAEVDPPDEGAPIG